MISFTKLLEYYNPDHEHMTKNQAYLYSSILLILVVIRMLGLHFYWMEMEHFGLKIQVALTSVIYSKCLKLSQEALSKVTLGQVVTLISNDVTRFHCGLIRYVHYFWLIYIQVVIILYLLYDMLGVTAIFGMSVFVIFVISQSE